MIPIVVNSAGVFNGDLSLLRKHTGQEIALQMVAGKLRVVLSVDDGNLMKVVAQGQPKQVEWSGMQVTEVTKTMTRPQPQPKLPQPLPEPETKLEITEVAVAQGAIQYSFL